MSNNYSDGTGVLVFSVGDTAKITKVIEGLFEPFGLDASYPGDGCAYIRHMTEDENPTWGDVYESLGEAFEIPDGDPQGQNDRHINVAATLRAIGERLGGDAQVALDKEIGNCNQDSIDEFVSIDEVFQLAMAVNDGHNLSAINFEYGYSCSKPCLGSFGGSGLYATKDFEINIYSGAASELGELTKKALTGGDEASMDAYAKKVVDLLLSGVYDPGAREKLRKNLGCVLAA
jgi:hypothetical protein